MIPEIQDGIRSVDGGVSNNVQMSVLVEEGTDFITASKAISPQSRRQRERHKSVASQVVSQLSPIGRLVDSIRSTLLLKHKAGGRQANSAQITFVPLLGSCGFYEFHIGQQIAEAVKPVLPPFIRPREESLQSLPTHRNA